MRQLISIILYSFYIPLYGLVVYLIKPVGYYAPLIERVNNLIIPEVLFVDNCSQSSHVIQSAENTLYIYRATETETQAYFYSLNTMNLDYCIHKFESKPQPVDELNGLFVDEHFDKFKPSHLVINLLGEEGVYMNLPEYEGLYKLKFLMKIWGLCAGLLVCHVLSFLFVPYLDLYDGNLVFSTVAFIIALLMGNWGPPEIPDELVPVSEDDSDGFDGRNDGNQDGGDQVAGNQDAGPSKKKTNCNTHVQDNFGQGKSTNTETGGTVLTATTTTTTEATGFIGTCGPILISAVPSQETKSITGVNPTTGTNTSTTGTTFVTEPTTGTASGITTDTFATTASGTNINFGVNAGTETQSSDQSGNNMSGGDAHEDDGQCSQPSQPDPSNQLDQPERYKRTRTRHRKPMWERRLKQARQAGQFGQPDSPQQPGSSVQPNQFAPSSPLNQSAPPSPPVQPGASGQPGSTSSPQQPGLSTPVYQPIPSVQDTVNLEAYGEEQSNNKENSCPGSDKSSDTESSNSDSQIQRSVESGEQQLEESVEEKRSKKKTESIDKESLYRLQAQVEQEGKSQRILEAKQKKKEAKRPRRENSRVSGSQQHQQQKKQTEDKKKAMEDAKKKQEGEKAKLKQEEEDKKKLEEEEYNSYSSDGFNTKDKGKQNADMDARNQDPIPHKSYWDVNSVAASKQSSKPWSSLFDEPNDNSREPSKPESVAENSWIQSSALSDCFHLAHMNPVTRARATTAADSSGATVSTATGRQGASSGSSSSAQHRSNQQNYFTIRLQGILRRAGSSDSSKSSKQPSESSLSSSLSTHLSPAVMFPFLSDDSLTVESSHAFPDNASMALIKESASKEEE